MGKGSGKLISWFIKLSAGVNIFEFKNLRYGRAYYFTKQIQNQLPIKSLFTFNKKRKVIIPLQSQKQISYLIFW